MCILGSEAPCLLILFCACKHKTSLSEVTRVCGALSSLDRAIKAREHKRKHKKVNSSSKYGSAIRLLEFTLTNTLISVDFANVTSSSCKDLRGVRDGGFFSAHLFIIHIERMLSLVSRQESECILDFRKINLQPYTKEIGSFFQTAGGLKKTNEDLRKLSTT